MNAPEPSFRHKAIELLRRGPFKRYIIGSAISDTGTWMQVMAQGWVLSTLTDRALVLGMVNMAAGLPTLLLTMIGGSAADRYDKRMILIIAQVVQICLALSLGFLVFFGYVQIWHIMVLAALLGVVIAFRDAGALRRSCRRSCGRIRSPPRLRSIAPFSMARGCSAPPSRDCSSAGGARRPRSSSMPSRSSR
jgi:MFS family permease